jgi:hypothetical protein
MSMKGACSRQNDFTFHFLISFVITVATLIHLLFIHQTVTNNRIGLSKNIYKIPFHPYFTTEKIVEPVSIAERSEASTVFGRSNVEIAGSNLARGMDVCQRFSVLCCPVCR